MEDLLYLPDGDLIEQDRKPHGRSNDRKRSATVFRMDSAGACGSGGALPQVNTDEKTGGITSVPERRLRVDDNVQQEDQRRVRRGNAPHHFGTNQTMGINPAERGKK